MAFCVDGTNDLKVDYLDWQIKLFDNPAKRKVIAKGRRAGLTKGFALDAIERMLGGTSPLFWCDTVNMNIDRYVERYFMPVLKQINPKYWDWRQQKKELELCGSKMDFRSADRPENIEGFGYALMYLNEAGIILNDRYLWENAILPMCMDTDPMIYIGGVPKGKRSKKDGKKHVFYELYEKARSTRDHRWQDFHYTHRDNPTLNQNAIMELNAELTGNAAAQEIEGQFVDENLNAIFRPEWWKEYDQLPPISEVSKIWQSWDTAFKDKESNDFSVCGTWWQVGKDIYLVDVWRGRVTFPDLLTKAQQLGDRWNPQLIMIEDKASGQSLIQSMRRGTNLSIHPVSVDRDKVARANACSYIVQEGRVWLPKVAPWLYDYRSEMEDCPDGEYWDQIDMTTQMLNYWIKSNKRSSPYVMSRFEL